MKVLFALLLWYGMDVQVKTQWRNELGKAEYSEETTDKLIRQLESLRTNETQGYLAVAYMMKSNHCSFPFTKLKYFNKGKRILEQAIQASPNDMELLFFRYNIQKRIPKALGYNHLAHDQIKLKAYTSVLENESKDPALFYKINHILSKN